MPHEKPVKYDIGSIVGLLLLLNVVAQYSGSKFVEGKNPEISGNRISISFFEASLQEFCLQSG